MTVTHGSETKAQSVQNVLANVQVWPHWREIALGAQKETGMSLDAFYTALPEYQRFMALHSTYHGGLGMFSEQIDELWHAHILNTLRYQEFCEQLIGRFVHHLPCSSFGLYLDTNEIQGLAPICEEPPATCSDPWPAPPDPSPVPDPPPDDEHHPSFRASILACTSRFVEAYIEAYQQTPNLAVYTRLAQKSYIGTLSE